MSLIPVYRAERDAGLEPAIRSSACVLASPVRVAERVELTARAAARLHALARQHARAGEGDFDLHHLTTVLVTVGWNKNDDVFDPLETWVARRTPEDKQLNYEHDDAKIVGHITKNWVVDGEGKVLADDTVVDDLPAKFHVVTAGVLYKHWQTPDLQERIDTLIAEIAEGKWFVSMECLFKGFDYALKAADGSTRVVARNDQTAFLSKHLRCYGGTGKYGDYRVGRLMRNIVFSGKGLVKNPANPESVILSSDAEAFAPVSAQLENDFPALPDDQVYSPASAAAARDNQESPDPMTVTTEQLQAQLTEARAEIDRLKATQTDAIVGDLKAKLDAAAAEKAAADALLLKANEAIAALKADADAKAKSLDEVSKTLAETQAELKGLYADKAKAARAALVKEKLGVDDAAAAEFVEANEDLADDKFGRQLDLVAKTLAAKVATNNAQPGNTTFPHGTPKAAPKATPAPAGPKATDKPAPMAGKGSESDEAGEQAAAATELEGVQADKGQVALSTSVTDSGVTELQKSIAAALGYKVDESAD